MRTRRRALYWAGLLIAMAATTWLFAESPPDPHPGATGPVREQNVDGSGYIAVHEQGVAAVDITNSELDVNVTNIEGSDPTDQIRDAVVDDATRLDASSLNAIEAKVDTVDGIVDDILADTAEIGAAGAGLTAIPWNAAWACSLKTSRWKRP